MSLQPFRLDEPWQMESRVKLNAAVKAVNENISGLATLGSAVTALSGTVATLDGTVTALGSAVSDLQPNAPNEQTGATYTFLASDLNSATLIFNRATAQVVTIPANVDQAIPVGTRLRCYRKGAGLVTFTPDGAVTLNKPTGIKPNRLMGVGVRKTSDETTANYTTDTAVAWTSELYDTDSFHDTSTNNSRLTIPSGLGITKVSLRGQMTLTSHTANVYSRIELRKNGGSTWDGASRIQFDGPETTHRIQAASLAVAATAGDYFELFYGAETDTSITVDSGNSNFQMVVDEINPVGTISYQHGFVTLEKIGTNEWTIEGPGLG